MPRMRDAIGALPDGVYLGEDHTDNDCFEKVDVAVRVAMTVEGDALTLDFSGSDPQMRGFKNSSLANTYSAAYMALSSFFDTDHPPQRGHLPLRQDHCARGIHRERPPTRANDDEHRLRRP